MKARKARPVDLGNFGAPLKAEHKPVLESFGEVATALLQGLPCRPDAIEARDTAIERLFILDQLVLGLFKSGCYVTS